MARLYANENFPHPVVHQLRVLGHDVLTSSEAGQANKAIPDNEILELASSEGRVVLTLNRKHFVRLHESGKLHHGIIVCTFNPNFKEQAGSIDAEIRNQPDLQQKLLRINRPANSGSAQDDTG